MNTGIDLIEVSRINSIKDLTKIFTNNEIDYYYKHNSLETLAGMYAAKEALLKSLQMGINNFSMLDIEILHSDNKAPYFCFYNSLKEYIDKKKINFSLSISHDNNYAVAIVINY